jgi:hypothetical protein
MTSFFSFVNKRASYPFGTIGKPRVSPLLSLNTLTRIILRPLSALSLDEGLNSPCDKNASAALSKREPISDDYLPSMRKAVLSISGNVYKQQEMEIDKLINDV